MDILVKSISFIPKNQCYALLLLNQLSHIHMFILSSLLVCLFVWHLFLGSVWPEACLSDSQASWRQLCVLFKDIAKNYCENLISWGIPWPIYFRITDSEFYGMLVNLKLKSVDQSTGRKKQGHSCFQLSRSSRAF